MIAAGIAPRRTFLAAAAATAAVIAKPARGADVTIRRMFIDAPSGQIHARVATPPAGADQKPSVICFHFTPGSGRMFEAVLPRLASDRRVIAFDTPGYGDSDPPPAPLDLGGLVSAMIAAMTKLGVEPGAAPIDLIGSATGAMIAIEMAARHPTWVRKLVLSGVPAFTAAERTSFAADIGRLEAEQNSDTTGSYVRKRLDDVLAQRGDDPLAPHIGAFIDSLSPGARWADAERAAAAYPAEDVLPKLNQPVLLFLNPNARSAATKRVPSLLKAGTVVTPPRAGSMAWQVAPDEMISHVRPFLDAGGP